MFSPFRFFQAYEREVDMGLTRTVHSDNREVPDFLSHVGNYDIYFTSSVPRKALNFWTMIEPFDWYTWALIGTSIGAIFTAFIVIEKSSISWVNTATKISIQKSKAVEYVTCYKKNSFLLYNGLHRFPHNHWADC